MVINDININGMIKLIKYNYIEKAGQRQFEVAGAYELSACGARLLQ